MQKTDCTRNCWIAGAAIGLLVWIFTSGIGQTSLMGGLFLGLITAVLMGLFLVWALCSGAGSAEDGRDDGRVRAALTHPGDVPATVAKPIHLAPRSETAPAAAAPAAAPRAPEAPKPAAAAVAVPAASAAPTPVTPVTTAPAPEPAKAEPAMVKAATAKPEQAKRAETRAAAKKPEAKAKQSAAKPEAKPDDLKQIKGVGPKLEKLLNENGVTRFAQIAAWDDAQMDSFAAKIGSMGGRIRSDDWVAQATILAAGGETEFSTRVEEGDVY